MTTYNASRGLLYTSVPTADDGDGEDIDAEAPATAGADD
jgi:hypothetical protein